MKIELEMENKTKENASIGRLIVIFFSLFQSIFFFGERCASYG